MKYQKFEISNFKGIEHIVFNLDKSPDANIYTLVGLNESGKTTILEAMNLFSASDKSIGVLEIPGSSITDYDSLIPISKRDNFNDVISIKVTLKLEDNDFKQLNDYLKTNSTFKNLKPVEQIFFIKNFEYKNSKFVRSGMRWSGMDGCTKSNPGKYKHFNEKFHNEINLGLAAICSKLLPNILYFPNFLFEFPGQLPLETKEKPTSKQSFYIDLVQDILNSLGNDTDINTHLIERIKSQDKSDRRSLDRLVQKMEAQVTDIIFDAWNIIFKRKIKNTKVKIDYDLDEDGLAFLEFSIEASDGIYQVNERSLGFRWFFIFLLFTQFRPYRRDSPQSIIFLFDEPASNLHSSAQTQLLKSFENLIGDGKIIYTTHSQHLINPLWLESTFVVKNLGLDLDKLDEYDQKKTNVTIEPYREFASKHPHNTAYFQPILDVLDYVPSNLENVADCVFLEGKNDFYAIKYFLEVILKRESFFNLSPSTSSSNIDTLISLYLGWGKDFVVLLDSDKEGRQQKARYIEQFGILAENRIFDLSDVDPSWTGIAIEKLFEKDELMEMQKLSYPESTTYNKTQFNRAVQESLIKNREFSFSQNTLDKFGKIIDFLNKRLKKE